MFSKARVSTGWLGLALLLTSGLISAGCTSGDADPASTAVGTVDTAPASSFSYAAAACPTPLLEGAPQLDLGPEFECGYLTVPENRTRPGGRTIDLPVARLRATSPNPKPDPIVYLTGGPGGPSLVTKDAKTWNRDRDVILFVQRGTLKADPFLSCREIDAFYTAAAGLNWEDPATATRSAEAVQACRDRLAVDGIDLAAYNTLENSADLADLRVALGLDTMNLYGRSYGTDLALQTMRDHPEGIRTAVLDAVLPPQENIIENGWDSAARSYRTIFDGCAAEAACALAYPQLSADFTRLVNELSADPRTVVVTSKATGDAVSVVIDGYKLANTVVGAAQAGTGALAEVPSLIENLATGDGTKAAAAIIESNPPELVSFGLELGVICSESAARTDPTRVLAVGRAVLPDWPDAVLAQTPQIPFIFGDCERWNVPAADERVSAPAVSTVPVLATSGSFDSATPPSFAEEAARTLPNARLLVFPGMGHGVAALSAPCFEAVMWSFLDNPDAVDASCVDALEIPPFVLP